MVDGDEPKDSYESSFHREKREKINTSFHSKAELRCRWKGGNRLDFFHVQPHSIESSIQLKSYGNGSICALFLGFGNSGDHVKLALCSTEKARLIHSSGLN